jgi:hypothetical protein
MWHSILEEVPEAQTQVGRGVKVLSGRLPILLSVFHFLKDATVPSAASLYLLSG